MGASNESPIGIFVNRLVTEKHIKPEEKDTVQNFLESLTSEIKNKEKNELSSVVLTFDINTKKCRNLIYEKGELERNIKEDKQSEGEC